MKSPRESEPADEAQSVVRPSQAVICAGTFTQLRLHESSPVYVVPLRSYHQAPLPVPGVLGMPPAFAHCEAKFAQSALKAT